MRLHEIENLNLLMPFTHQFMATVQVDVERLSQLLRLCEERDELQLYHADPPEDGWSTVYIACSDDETRQRVEDGWG